MTRRSGRTSVQVLDDFYVLATRRIHPPMPAGDARAEVRRAAAVASEQEMKAKTQEMRAKVVEAEAEVPLAMADAFRNGRLGIMDYQKFNNIQADTQMRSSIAQGGDSGQAQGRKDE